MYRHTIALSLLSATLAGCTSSATRPGNTAIAAVQAVYVEVAPDIYVSERLLTAPPARDYWVKVAITDSEAAGSTAMALVPATLRLAAGDQVAVAVAALPARDGSLTARRTHRVLDRLSHGALAASATRPPTDLIDRYLSASAKLTP